MESSTGGVTSFTTSAMMLTTQNALAVTAVASIAIILYFRPKWAVEEKTKALKWNLVLMAAGSATVACYFLVRRWS